MKKVVSIVLNNFVNDARVYKEAKTLLAAGYQLTVVCLHDEGLPLVEMKDGINVHRINLLSRSLPSNLFTWSIKYLEFFIKVISGFFNADVFHCHDLNTLPVGAFVKLFKGGKLRLIYDAHEFETEQHANPNALMHEFSILLERWLLKLCDVVITVSKPIAEAYAQRYHIAEPELIMNCPPFSKAVSCNTIREKLLLGNDVKILLYQGGLSSERGIENMLLAFSNIDKRELALVIMGYCPLENMVKQYANQHENIFYLPAVSQKELPAFTASADIGLLFYENTCLNNYYCLPNKLFEYLMAGVPVAVSPLFELKRLVEKHKLGIVSSDTSSSGIQAAMLEILNVDFNSFKINAEEFNEEYNWEKQAEKLLQIYQRICAV